MFTWKLSEHWHEYNNAVNIILAHIHTCGRSCDAIGAVKKSVGIWVPPVQLQISDTNTPTRFSLSLSELLTRLPARYWTSGWSGHVSLQQSAECVRFHQLAFIISRLIRLNLIMTCCDFYADWFGTGLQHARPVTRSRDAERHVLCSVSRSQRGRARTSSPTSPVARRCALLFPHHKLSRTQCIFLHTAAFYIKKSRWLFFGF